MTTSDIVTGSVLTAVTTMDIVTGSVLQASVTTTDIVTGAVLTAGSTSTVDVVTGAFLLAGTVEPYVTVTLPAGTWTQVSGPTVAPPSVLVPGAQTPVPLVYSQANGTQFTIGSYPHIIFYRDASGNLKPVRRTRA